MDLLLVGASHRTAGVDERGRLARRAAALGPHDRSTDVAELVVLATCHRVEVLAAVRDVESATHALRRALIELDGLYAHAGAAAVRHLSRVAAGLDSLIVGEAEISGQIRRAASAGRASGAVGPYLDRVLAGVLRASGRARSETRIAEGVLSAAAAAVSLVERTWPSLDGRTVMVVGAGEAGRQALGRLKKRRAGRLLVASRSAHHAADAAVKTGASVVALEHLGAALADVDAVIVATRASGYLLDYAMVASACAARTDRPLEIVDLSVPRVVDPAVEHVPGARLRTVDDLGDVVRESIARRAREIPRVERIVADEAARTYQQFIARRDRRIASVA